MRWILFRRCGLQPYNYSIASGRNLGRIAILGLALLSAVAAAVLANGLLDGKRDGEEVVAKAPVPATVDVLVASRKISIGQGIARSSVKWQKWLKASLAPGVITRQAQPDAPAQLEGAMARASFVPGEVVFENKIVRKHAGGLLSLMLPSGMRAVSTKISPETGAGGFILPNDRVDVIVTRRKNAEGAGSPQFESETVLRSVRVLAIDQATESKNSEKQSVAVGKTATLELLPRQAEILARSEAMGVLSLALRSFADATPDKRKREQSDSYVVIVHRPGKTEIATEHYSFTGNAQNRPANALNAAAASTVNRL